MGRDVSESETGSTVAKSGEEATTGTLHFKRDLGRLPLLAECLPGPDGQAGLFDSDVPVAPQGFWNVGQPVRDVQRGGVQEIK